MFIKIDGKLINLDNVTEVLMSKDYDGKPELRFRDNTGETFESFRLETVPAAQRAYDYLCGIATFDFDDSNGSNPNVFHFDNGDGTIGQMQITDTPPAGEWNITTSAIGTDTDLYTLSNGVHKLEILDRQVAYSVFTLLNGYSQQLSAARNDSIELSNDVAATDKLLTESQAENTRLQGVINEAVILATDAYETSDHDANNHKKVFRVMDYLTRHED